MNPKPEEKVVPQMSEEVCFQETLRRRLLTIWLAILEGTRASDRASPRKATQCLVLDGEFKYGMPVEQLE
jgi:hypothetical protein